MIGKIYKIIISYYDKKTNSMSFKWRPGLVISERNGYDYDRIILPVSRITMQKYFDKDYDIPVSIKDYPLLNLKEDSYIRTGKQTFVNESNIGSEISDLRKNYPDLYIDILAHVEEFNQKLINEAINF